MVRGLVSARLLRAQSAEEPRRARFEFRPTRTKPAQARAAWRLVPVQRLVLYAIRSRRARQRRAQQRRGPCWVSLREAPCEIANDECELSPDRLSRESVVKASGRPRAAATFSAASGRVTRMHPAC